MTLYDQGADLDARIRSQVLRHAVFDDRLSGWPSIARAGAPGAHDEKRDVREFGLPRRPSERRLRRRRAVDPGDDGGPGLGDVPVSRGHVLPPFRSPQPRRTQVSRPS